MCNFEICYNILIFTYFCTILFMYNNYPIFIYPFYMNYFAIMSLSWRDLTENLI